MAITDAATLALVGVQEQKVQGKSCRQCRRQSDAKSLDMLVLLNSAGFAEMKRASFLLAPVMQLTSFSCLVSVTDAFGSGF